ncbi:MAG TPA: MarR family transcriptional regulator [Thermodesulfobacteriota bacterium]|nr:MarR family transcriptional regulator [Thermodesulfobacteriota bacterium]
MGQVKTSKGNKVLHKRSGGNQNTKPAAVALSKAYFGDSALASLIGEVVALFHRLRIVSEQIHRQGEMTSGKRGILGSLDRFGPQTVPEMARARPVSRQYIQTLVNQLMHEGLVEFIENPAHKRSHFVRLTPKGKELLDSMIQRETELLSQLKLDIPEKALHDGAGVLKAVRELFESKQWKELLKEDGV